MSADTVPNGGIGVAAQFDPIDDLDAALATILHEAVEKGSLLFGDLRRAGVTEQVIANVA